MAKHFYWFKTPYRLWIAGHFLTEDILENDETNVLLLWMPNTEFLS
jgi:hypothetical protein